MVSPPKRDARAVKKEVFKTIHDLEEEEIQHAPFVSGSKAAEVVEEEIYHISGKLFFDMVLANSHVNAPYSPHLPVTAIPMLPQATVPVVLTYGGKTWTMSYSGDSNRPRFDSGWKAFITDNDLKCGDACVFEKMESSNTNTFKVHILRVGLPPELQELVDSRGSTAGTPIVLD